MTRKFSALCAASILAASAAPAPAQAPEQPRWHLDGATSRCVLMRRLEGAPGPAAFVLRTVPGSGTYDVMLAVPDLDRSLRRVRLSTGPGGATHEQDVTTVDLPRGLGEALAVPYLPASFAAEFGRASQLVLADAAGRPLGRWTIPAAGRAAQALAACEAEKQVEWGAAPAAVEAGATPPRTRGDSDHWLTPRDLGLGDVTSPTAVAAVFRLALDSNGRATGCTLLESAASVELDRGACRALVRRARYEPARDPSGNPVHGVAIYRFESQMNGVGSSRNWRGNVPLSTRSR